MAYANLLFLLAALGIGYFSAREKAFWNLQRKGPGSKSSPLSKAVSELVGTAGGVYLALGMLASFLGLELPERIGSNTFGLDPLAVISICLALAQPYLIRLSYLIKRYI